MGMSVGRCWCTAGAQWNVRAANDDSRTKWMVCGIGMLSSLCCSSGRHRVGSSTGATSGKCGSLVLFLAGRLGTIVHFVASGETTRKLRRCTRVLGVVVHRDDVLHAFVYLSLGCFQPAHEAFVGRSDMAKRAGLFLHK